MAQNVFTVTVNGAVFQADFADTTGAQALKELLAQGSLTIEMDDYAGFEKVGALGRSLPASDVQTTAQLGDIVLYQGSQIVLFYGINSWSYTRLGKIAGSFRRGGRAGQRLRLGHFCAEKMRKHAFSNLAWREKKMVRTDGRKKGTG